MLRRAKLSKRNIVVYVAAPYRSNTIDGIWENVITARQYAKRVWEAGYTALSPHCNSFLMDGLCPDEAFLEGCIELLKRCDYMIVPSDTISTGMRLEMEHCIATDKPYVFGNIDICLATIEALEGEKCT